MRLFTLLSALLLAEAAFAQAPAARYSIKGYLTNLKGRTVYLLTQFQSASAPFGSKADSCFSADGHFSFRGVLGEANYYTVAFKDDGSAQSKSFLLDSNPITVIGHADSLYQLSIVGSPALRDQLLWDKMLETPLKRQNELMRLILKSAQKGDTANTRIYRQEYESLLQEITAIKADFIESHPGSLVSLFELNSLIPDIPNEKARHLWNHLDFSLQQHSVGIGIHNRIFFNPERKPEPRQYIPDLILADKQDKPVSLLTYKGNVVLIDFWASWCDHCRQEHNRLKSLYKQYKDKGLQIISISVDEDTDAWKKALQKAGLPWTQLTDRVGSRNMVGTQYGNGSLPINLLIDKEGYVIRKGLQGSELEKHLAVVFNQ
ncbi:redoxin family protein [Larkinella arboricola]